MPLKPYKINRKQKLKPNSNRYYVQPKTMEELELKYGDKLESIWNNPENVQHLLDIFGEEFFYMYDTDIKTLYGEDILDIYSILVDKDDFKIPEFPELDEIANEKKINTSTSNNSESIFEEELKQDEAGFYYKEEERIHADPVKLEERLYDDGDVASNIEYWTKRLIEDDMVTSWHADFVQQSTNLPQQFKVEGNKNTLHDALETYADNHKIEFDFSNSKGYGYHPEYEPYQRGRFIDEDAKRLDGGTQALAQVKHQHSKHGIGYIFKHPLNYFYEWKAIHNINKSLTKVGFTQNEIDAKTNNYLQQLQEEDRREQERLAQEDTRTQISVSEAESDLNSSISSDMPKKGKSMQKENVEIEINNEKF